MSGQVSAVTRTLRSAFDMKSTDRGSSPHGGSGLDVSSTRLDLRAGAADVREDEGVGKAALRGRHLDESDVGLLKNCGADHLRRRGHIEPHGAGLVGCAPIGFVVVVGAV